MCTKWAPAAWARASAWAVPSTLTRCRVSSGPVKSVSAAACTTASMRAASSRYSRAPSPRSARATSPWTVLRLPAWGLGEGVRMTARWVRQMTSAAPWSTRRGIRACPTTPVAPVTSTVRRRGRISASDPLFDETLWSSGSPWARGRTVIAWCDVASQLATRIRDPGFVCTRGSTTWAADTNDVRLTGGPLPLGTSSPAAVSAVVTLPSLEHDHFPPPASACRCSDELGARRSPCSRAALAGACRMSTPGASLPRLPKAVPGRRRPGGLACATQRSACWPQRLPRRPSVPLRSPRFVTTRRHARGGIAPSTSWRPQTSPL